MIKAYHQILILRSNYRLAKIKNSVTKSPAKSTLKHIC